MKLQVIMADTHSTTCRIQFENEWAPYKRRVVTIELTPNQVSQLQKRQVGIQNGTEIFEEILDCFIEED